MNSSINFTWLQIHTFERITNMHDLPSIVNAAGKGKPEPAKFVVPSANPSKAPIQYFSFTIKF